MYISKRIQRKYKSLSTLFESLFRLDIIVIFDIWRLFPFHIPQMRFDHPNAIDIQAHPSPIAEGGKDHFQIDVIAKNHPETIHDLKENGDVGSVEPRQHQSANFLSNANQQQYAQQDQNHEVTDCYAARALKSTRLHIWKNKVILYWSSSSCQVLDKK